MFEGKNDSFYACIGHALSITYGVHKKKERDKKVIR